jgi:hypothetical protein
MYCTRTMQTVTVRKECSKWIERHSIATCLAVYEEKHSSRRNRVPLPDRHRFRPRARSLHYMQMFCLPQKLHAALQQRFKGTVAYIFNRRRIKNEIPPWVGQWITKMLQANTWVFKRGLIFLQFRSLYFPFIWHFCPTVAAPYFYLVDPLI